MNQQNQIKQGLEIKAITDIYPKRSFTLKQQLIEGKKGPIYTSIAKFWGDNSNKEFVLKFNKKSQVDDTERNFLFELISEQNQKERNELLDNVIRIFDCIEYEEYDIIVMEIGVLNLLSYIQNQQLTKLEKLQICLDVLFNINQISLPIYYLHINNLKHCKLTLQNYVKVNDKFKLINFGNISNKYQNKYIPIEYTAPEILDNYDNLSDKVDIWQLGCLFYQIYTGNQLFQGDQNQIKEKLLNHSINQYNLNYKISQLNCQSEMKNLIIQMLQPDPTKRISITEVVDKLQQIQNPNSILISQKLLQKFFSNNQNQVNKQQQQELKSSTQDKQPSNLKQQTQVNDNNKKNKNISQESNENSNKISQDQHRTQKVNNQQLQQLQGEPQQSLNEEQLNTMKDKIEKELYEKFEEQMKAQESKYKEEIQIYQNDLNQLKSKLVIKRKQEEKGNLLNEIQYQNEIITLQNEILKLQNEKNETNKNNSQTNFQIEFHESNSLSNLLQQIVEEFEKQSPESKQDFVMQNKVIIDKLAQHQIKNINR